MKKYPIRLVVFVVVAGLIFLLNLVLKIVIAGKLIA